MNGNFGEKFPSNGTVFLFLAPKTGKGLSCTIYKRPVNFSLSLDMKPGTGNPNKWCRKFNFAFQTLPFLAVNRMDTRTFRESEEKQQQSRLSFLFFRLNFIVYTDLDNRETARASDKKQGRRIFFGRKT